MNITTSVLEIIVPICIGQILRLVRLLGDEEGKIIQKLCIRFTVPVLIFYSMYEVNRRSLELITPMVSSFVLLTVILFGIGWLGSCLVKETSRKNAVHACIMFGNYGWLGLGVGGILFGSEGIVRVIFFILLWWPVFYALGLPAGLIHTRERKGNVPIDKVFKIVFPMLVALGLGLWLNFLEIDIPKFLSASLLPFAEMTVPLILLSVGAMLDLRRSHKNIGLALFISFITLLIAPFIGWLVGNLLQQSDISLKIIILESSMPVATLTPVLAQNIKMDLDLVNTSIAISTVISLITLPVIATILI